MTLVAAASLWALASIEAVAQTADQVPSLRAHHVTLSGGLVWTGGYSIGETTAELRGNAVGSTAPPFTLFRAASSVDAAAGVEGRVGYAIARNLMVDVGVSYQRPGLTAELSADEEAAAVTLDAERLSQYIVDVGVLWQFPGRALGSRVRPFVIGGGGYLRQLYDERTVVETGSVYYAGAGVRYWLRGGDGQRRSIGLRGDGRAMWRRGGVDFENEVRVIPVLRVDAFVEF
jgi:hypothetical protein